MDFAPLVGNDQATGLSHEISLDTIFLSVFSASVFQNYWKHRGTENTEGSDFTEKQLVKENFMKQPWLCKKSIN
jgi:hypothetical protein